MRTARFVDENVAKVAAAEAQIAQHAAAYAGTDDDTELLELVKNREIEHIVDVDPHDVFDIRFDLFDLPRERAQPQQVRLPDVQKLLRKQIGSRVARRTRQDARCLSTVEDLADCFDDCRGLTRTWSSKSHQ